MASLVPTLYSTQITSTSTIALTPCRCKASCLDQSVPWHRIHFHKSLSTPKVTGPYSRTESLDHHPRDSSICQELPPFKPPNMTYPWRASSLEVNRTRRHFPCCPLLATIPSFPVRMAREHFSTSMEHGTEMHHRWYIAEEACELPGLLSLAPYRNLHHLVIQSNGLCHGVKI